MFAIDVSNFCALGLVLAGLEALRVVTSAAAAVEPCNYCAPLEDLGKRRGWADVLPLHGVGSSRCAPV